MRQSVATPTRRACGTPRPLRIRQSDPFQQIAQLRRRDRHHAIPGKWPDENVRAPSRLAYKGHMPCRLPQHLISSRAGPGTRTNARCADPAATSLHQQRQPQSPCACPCGQSPATTCTHSGAGSSASFDLRQRAIIALTVEAHRQLPDPYPRAGRQTRFSIAAAGGTRRSLPLLPMTQRHRRKPRRRSRHENATNSCRQRKQN